MGVTPRRSPPLLLSLDAAERICFSKDHLHRRNRELSIGLSRAVPMRTLHQRGSNKRQTPIQVRSKSTLHAFEKILSNSSPDPSGPSTALEKDSIGGGVVGVNRPRLCARVRSS